MTARRVVTLLVVGLLVVGFAIWMASTRHLEHATLAGDTVMVGLEPALNAITEVRLHKGNGTQTTLRKGASDWIVGERDYPADSGKVRKLLLDLASLKVVEEKTRTPENYPQLGVEEVDSPKATGTRVDAVTPQKTYSAIVGKSASGKSVYVRVAGSPQSLLASPLVTLDAEPPRWLDHTLLDVSQDRVKEVDVKPSTGPAYTASRDKKEQQDFTVSGVPKGRELSSPAAADPIAGSLASLTLDDVRRPGTASPDPSPAASPAPSAASPSAPSSARSAAPPAPSAAPRVTFKTFDGLEVDITGHKDGTRTFIAVGPKSTAKETESEAQTLAARVKGWEYEIPSYKYDGLFRPLEDLLKKPPEPAKSSKGGKSDKSRRGAAPLPPGDSPLPPEPQEPPQP